ncbi:uncharacterized protein LOC144129753 [Amblyomma americanum]
MGVTGRVDAHLNVTNSTDKLVIMANNITLVNIRVAVINCTAGRGMQVRTVSRYGDFVIIRLWEELEVDLEYTLSTIFTYHWIKDGPITLKQTMARMQLQPGKAHLAYPCYDKKDFVVPINLRLITPRRVKAISNEGYECKPRKLRKDLYEWRFLSTSAILLHKLSWVVVPEKLKGHVIIPKVLRQFAEIEDVELKVAANRSFQFLAQYFQGEDNRYIHKLDFVLTTEEQDNMGFVLMKTPVAIKGVALCKKIAEQWTVHLLPRYERPSWLATSGVDYLCRLAFADDEDGVVAAFQPEIDKCMTNTATDDIKRLLAFRMAHIALGDIITKEAIQRHVSENMFTDATPYDATLDLFGPALPMENLQAFMAAGFQTVKLVRTFGAEKTLTWKEPKEIPVLVATNAISSALKLKTPDGFIVTWLDASNPQIQLALADTDSLFVNPGVMGCYGVELDYKAWALVGHKMEMETPNVLNAHYLLSQASKQYCNVSWPHDITGFLWTCGVLKGGDKERWDQYGKQFVISESHAYTMLMLTSDLDKAYKKRVDDLIRKRVEAINVTTDLLPSAEETSTAVVLANVACFIGSAKCAEFTAGLENLVVDSDFKSSVQNLTLLAPEAVACNLASSVADDAAFDAKLKDAPLSMRLAFAACVREGIGEERLKRLALDAISNDLDREGTTNVRLSPYLRKKILDLLKLQEPSPLSQSRLLQAAAIKRANKLRAVRSLLEAKTIQRILKPVRLGRSAGDDALKSINETDAAEYEPLEYWARQNS